MDGPARRDDQIGKEYVLSIRSLSVPPGAATDALVSGPVRVYLQIPGRRFDEVKDLATEVNVILLRRQ